MIDRGNLIDTPQQDTQNRIMIVLGLLKSGKVEVAAHDRSGKPDKTSWNKFVLIMETLFSTEMRIP